jgi:iron complex transport system permease protein
MNASRATAIWIALGAATLVVLVASLAMGSVALPVSRAIGALFHAHSATPDIADDIVLTLRLPRALAGFASGALLAFAGALLQVLLRNPLAEPYVLGVSGGAATFALAAMLGSLPWWGVDIAACAGAFASIVLVLGLARKDLWQSGQDASPRLLLTGVVIASGWGALITLILSVAPENRLRGMIFWLTGDLNGAAAPWPALIALAVVLAVIVPVAPQLNVLLRGDTTARALGVPVERLRLRVYLVASIAAAAAVTTAGTIGFVGLVVPHLVRLALGAGHRVVLPGSALLGAAVLVLADLAARSLAAPAELPVGVVTALLGAPFFLWLLRRRAVAGEGA